MHWDFQIKEVASFYYVATSWYDDGEKMQSLKLEDKVLHDFQFWIQFEMGVLCLLIFKKCTEQLI